MKDSCIFCGSYSIIVSLYKNYHKIDCSSCKSTSFIESSFIDYKSSYSNDLDYDSDLISLMDINESIMWHHKIVINDLAKNNNTARKIGLDVGCFNGFFVRKMLNLGYDFYGVDFNSKAIEHGVRNFDLQDRLYNCFAEHTVLNTKFDIVTCFEVIEHTKDPQSLIDKLYHLVSQNGVVYVSCPNCQMVWRPPLDNPPHHLSRISPFGLKRLAEKSGFSVLAHYQQMSTTDLLRHCLGLLFRSKSSTSLRGGSINENLITRSLRTMLNRYGFIIKYLVFPLDYILYNLGLRYIGQLIILKKNCYHKSLQK